ncbi:hypothetical protein [Aurantivibrio infirmus]
MIKLTYLLLFMIIIAGCSSSPSLAVLESVDKSIHQNKIGSLKLVNEEFVYFKNIEGSDSVIDDLEVTKWLEIASDVWRVEEIEQKDSRLESLVIDPISNSISFWLRDSSFSSDYFTLNRTKDSEQNKKYKTRHGDYYLVESGVVVHAK